MENKMLDADTVILITRNGMGEADQVLQHKLISKYLKLLDEKNILPGAICFYSEAVHLATVGSPVIETLKSLEKKGVRLIVCSVSVKYFDLLDKVKVGFIGGIEEILDAQRSAAKVIAI